jgi:hypothetical protein
MPFLAGSTPREFCKLLRSEFQRYAKIVRAANIQPE